LDGLFFGYIHHIFEQLNLCRKMVLSINWRNGTEITDKRQVEQNSELIVSIVDINVAVFLRATIANAQDSEEQQYQKIERLVQTHFQLIVESTEVHCMSSL
jgi:regulator of RNase E activity RraB